MKRMLAFALSLALALMGLSCGALAEEAWNCPGCGEQNLTSNFCPECGSARPAVDWICPNCGRTNQRLFCPDCGTSCDAAQQGSSTAAETTWLDDEVQETDDAKGSATVLQADGLMVPDRMIDLMNACIAIACEKVAADMSVDAEQLTDMCALFETEITPQFISYGNKTWDIELYFYYPGVDAPDPQMEAAHWCMEVRGSDGVSDVLRSIAFSATLAALMQLDPDMDGAATVELLTRREHGSQYQGNGYLLTYLVAEGGDDTQVMVERT